MRRKNVLGIVLVILLAAAILLPACHRNGQARMVRQDIVSTAISAGDFNTLVTALRAAGLVETLQGKGPYTVFAPTDEAFRKLPAGTLDDLLKPENKEKLASILTYHVVPGRVTASEVITLSSANTVNGQSLAIKTVGENVMVDGAKVVKTDIECSNGVIHVIDAVILPR